MDSFLCLRPHGPFLNLPCPGKWQLHFPVCLGQRSYSYFWLFFLTTHPANPIGSTFKIYYMQNPTDSHHLCLCLGPGSSPLGSCHKLVMSFPAFPPHLCAVHISQILPFLSSESSSEWKPMASQWPARPLRIWPVSCYFSDLTPYPLPYFSWWGTLYVLLPLSRMFFPRYTHVEYTNAQMPLIMERPSYSTVCSLRPPRFSSLPSPHLISLRTPSPSCIRHMHFFNSISVCLLLTRCKPQGLGV